MDLKTIQSEMEENLICILNKKVKNKITLEQIDLQDVLDDIRDAP